MKNSQTSTNNSINDVDNCDNTEVLPVASVNLGAVDEAVSISPESVSIVVHDVENPSAGLPDAIPTYESESGSQKSLELVSSFNGNGVGNLPDLIAGSPKLSKNSSRSSLLSDVLSFASLEELSVDNEDPLTVRVCTPDNTTWLEVETAMSNMGGNSCRPRLMVTAPTPTNERPAEEKLVETSKLVVPKEKSPVKEEPRQESPTSFENLLQELRQRKAKNKAEAEARESLKPLATETAKLHVSRFFDTKKSNKSEEKQESAVKKVESGNEPEVVELQIKPKVSDKVDKKDMLKYFGAARVESKTNFGEEDEVEEEILAPGFDLEKDDSIETDILDEFVDDNVALEEIEKEFNEIERQNKTNLELLMSAEENGSKTDDLLDDFVFPCETDTSNSLEILNSSDDYVNDHVNFNNNNEAEEKSDKKIKISEIITKNYNDTLDKNRDDLPSKVCFLPEKLGNMVDYETMDASISPNDNIVSNTEHIERDDLEQFKAEDMNKPFSRREMDFLKKYVLSNIRAGGVSIRKGEDKEDNIKHVNRDQTVSVSESTMRNPETFTKETENCKSNTYKKNLSDETDSSVRPFSINSPSGVANKIKQSLKPIALNHQTQPTAFIARTESSPKPFAPVTPTTSPLTKHKIERMVVHHQELLPIKIIELKPPERLSAVVENHPLPPSPSSSPDTRASSSTPLGSTSDDSSKLPGRRREKESFFAPKSQPSTPVPPKRGPKLDLKKSLSLRLRKHSSGSESPGQSSLETASKKSPVMPKKKNGPLSRKSELNDSFRSVDSTKKDKCVIS